MSFNKPALIPAQARGAFAAGRLPEPPTARRVMPRDKRPSGRPRTYPGSRPLMTDLGHGKESSMWPLAPHRTSRYLARGRAGLLAAGPCGEARLLTARHVRRFAAGAEQGRQLINRSGSARRGIAGGGIPRSRADTGRTNFLL